MPIKIGSTDINEIQIGSTPYESVYVGSDKVFSRPLLIDLTVGQYVSNNYPRPRFYGYDQFYSMGSIANAQSQPNSNWFSSGAIITLGYYSYQDQTFPYPVELNVSSVVTNNDSMFTTMTINNTVFNRVDAASFSTGTNNLGTYSRWKWSTGTVPQTNPFGTVGGIDRVRFERDV